MDFKERLKIVIGDESLRSFAQKSDISEGTLRAYLAGTSEPTMKNLINISAVGKVYIDWLATEEGPMHKLGGITEPPNGYHTAARAPTSPDPDAYCYVPLYDVYASAGHGSLIDQEPVIDRLAFKKDWLKGEMGLSPENCCLIHVTGDSMEPTLHKKDVVMLDRSHTIYIEDGVYCLRIDGGLLVKRLQRINAQQLEVISDNPVYRAYPLDTADVQIIGRVVWAGKRF
jgi:phage repressor protein C with HTH and peptisase S24 domain